MYNRVCVVYSGVYLIVVVFFFQAEDGIRDLVRSRGLGDVYKRQQQVSVKINKLFIRKVFAIEYHVANFSHSELTNKEPFLILYRILSLTGLVMSLFYEYNFSFPVQ